MGNHNYALGIFLIMFLGKPNFNDFPSLYHKNESIIESTKHDS